MNSEKMKGDYERTREVILSCQNMDQLKVGIKMYNQLNKLHELPERDLDKLENLIGLMKIKCNGGDINEERSSIGNEFHKAAQMSGVQDLKSIVFSEEEEFKGGEADEMTPLDLAEKHNVDIKKIENEIKVGTKIEMEHTDSKEMARQIALDHISEYPKYYTDPEYGIIAIEDKMGGNKKTIRLSKNDLKRLEKGFTINVDGLNLSYRSDDDIDEATSAMSSGSFVGNLSNKPISRTFKKSEIPVSVNGLDTEKEIIEEEELEEATSVGSVGGQYVTPKFWAKDKQNWRNRVKKAYPGGKFVNIKKKCKNYPYCDQGSGGPSGSPITLSDSSDMEIDGYFNENRIIKTIKKINLKTKR